MTVFLIAIATFVASAFGLHLTVGSAWAWIGASAITVVEIAVLLPFQLWLANVAEIERLKKAIAPKLKCTFGPDIRDCINRDTYEPRPSKPTPLIRTWYRVQVETVGTESVVGCSGRFLSVKYNEEERLGSDKPKLGFTAATDPDTLSKWARFGFS